MARKRQLIIPVFIPFGGCPHVCVFCNQKTVTASSSMPSKEDVSLTVKRYLSTWKGKGKKEIAFYGGSFTGLEKGIQVEYLNAAREFTLDGSIDSIRVSTRPDCMDWEAAALLKRYGVGTVELGVQSMSDEVLKLSGRGHTSFDTALAAGVLKDGGFSVGMQIMPGLPGDTENSIVETALRVLELKPDFVRIYPTLVLKDTGLYDMYIKGEYSPWTLDNMRGVLRRVYKMFIDAGIPVARVGLHSSEGLENSVAAGPYHPSLRDFIKDNRLL